MSKKGGYQILDMLDVGMTEGTPRRIPGAYEACRYGYRKRIVVSGLTLANIKYIDFLINTCVLTETGFELSGAGFDITVDADDVVTIKHSATDGVEVGISIGKTETLPEGSDATVVNVGTYKNAILDFGIPTGKTGRAATVEIGTVYTLPPGQGAYVRNVGTPEDAVLNIGLPRGNDGQPGEGTPGATGEAATIGIGTVTTLPAGSQATVTNTGDEHAAILNFGIPTGKTGATGNPGLNGKDGSPGAPGADGGYYTPSVSSAGLLSWNPSAPSMPSVPSVNIKGPAGDPAALTLTRFSKGISPIITDEISFSPYTDRDPNTGRTIFAIGGTMSLQQADIEWVTQLAKDFIYAVAELRIFSVAQGYGIKAYCPVYPTTGQSPYIMLQPYGSAILQKISSSSVSSDMILYDGIIKGSPVYLASGNRSISINGVLFNRDGSTTIQTLPDSPLPGEPAETTMTIYFYGVRKG